MNEQREALADVLAGHRLTTPVQCSCGWREHWSGAGETHAEHQADALSDALARLLAEAEQRGAARVTAAVDGAIERCRGYDVPASIVRAALTPAAPQDPA